MEILSISHPSENTDSVFSLLHLAEDEKQKLCQLSNALRWTELEDAETSFKKRIENK